MYRESQQYLALTRFPTLGGLLYNLKAQALKHTKAEDLSNPPETETQELLTLEIKDILRCLAWKPSQGGQVVNGCKPFWETLNPKP